MSGVPLLLQDAPSIASAFPPQWGIFWQNGQEIATGLVLPYDSFGSIDYSREYSVSDYPQEGGAFESYNKVQTPFDTRITLLSSQTRRQLLNALEPALTRLDLVVVVTPEVNYPSANLTRYSLHRTSRNGVQLIAVDVWCREIRFTAITTFGNTSPQSAAQSQPNAGTDRPIGQVNSGANLVPGSGGLSTQGSTGGISIAPLSPFLASPASPGEVLSSVGPTGGITATNTGSTNAAFPVQSGPIQSITITPGEPTTTGAITTIGGGINLGTISSNPPQ